MDDCLRMLQACFRKRLSALQYACPEANLDFSGNDIAQISPDAGVSTWEECGYLCNIFPTCLFWDELYKTRSFGKTDSQ